MSPPLIPSLPPSIKRFGMWNSHHTAPPAQRASLPAPTHSFSTSILIIHLGLLSSIEATCLLRSWSKIPIKCSSFFFFFCTLVYYFAATVDDQFHLKPFFSCTPSHSLVCGVNFHYTALRYNDLKWALITDFCRCCFPSLICILVASDIVASQFFIPAWLWMWMFALLAFVLVFFQIFSLFGSFGFFA